MSARRGVTFALSVPHYVAARALGGLSDTVLYGRLSALSLQEHGHLELPGPEWVRLRTILCGICGTDLANLQYKVSPMLEPFASFPAVLGHEVLARVTEVGTGVSTVQPGQRVAVDPMISCLMRGFAGDDQCPRCVSGHPATCWRAGEEGPLSLGGRQLAPGVTLGFHRDLAGGWGDELVAHESQLHPVPDRVEDRTAVLVEPLSVGVHAILHSSSDPQSPVLVVGSGPIALGVVWALRALGHCGPIVAQVKRAREAEVARSLGASSVVTAGTEVKEALLDSGAKVYQPILGAEVYAGGGFPTVYDCVGSRESLTQAFACASAGGQVVLLGCAGHVRNLDLTLLWARELSARGFVGYGRERWQEREMHTFAVTLELLERSSAPLADMVSVMPLADYRRALDAAAHRRKSGVLKVALAP